MDVLDTTKETGLNIHWSTLPAVPSVGGMHMQNRLDYAVILIHAASLITNVLGI